MKRPFSATTAIIEIDSRRHLLSIAIYAAMAIGMPIFFAVVGAPSETVFSMLIVFAVTVCAMMTPFWLVAMDRIRGGMLVLWRLPIHRRTIVATKCMESVAVNTAILLTAALIAHAYGTVSMIQLWRVLEYGVPLNSILTGTCVAAYFVMNPQIAIFGALAGVGAVSLAFASIAPILSRLPIAATVLAYAAATATLVVVTLVVGKIVSRVDDPT